MINTHSDPHRWWDPLAIIVLLAALLTASSRLVATGWTEHLSLIQILTFFGMISGLALGKSRFSPITSLSIATVYGTFGIVWQLGKTLPSDLLWAERLWVLGNRLGIIIYQIIHRLVLRDSLLFLVLMCALFWVLSVHAGYILVRRGRAWSAVLPTGLALFVIHAFDPLVFTRGLYLAVYFFFALILVARLVFLHYHIQWQANRTALPPQLSFNYLRFTVFAALLLVILAWTVPGMANALPSAQHAWKPVVHAWEKARQRIDNLFAPLRSTVLAVSSIYGESTTLGRGNPLSDAPVFSVQTPADIPPGVRLYWRARSYDIYDNGQWISSINAAHPYDPQRDDLRSPLYSGRWLGSFEFTAMTNLSTLFVPTIPLWVNYPGQVEYVDLSDGTVDISDFRPDPTLNSGQTYEAQSAVNYATIAQLKEAGTDYPEWVTERYLQLPDSITSRTQELAQDITAGQATVYDKVVAVTRYLRDNIEYTPTINTAPPNNQEVIDWFIFDLKQGFCNYYSTAEIVLLRAVGIPSRWALGYAQGDQLQGDRTGGQVTTDKITFVVRQRDAHAWPEVFFPGIGWVEFEPTASQPDIPRIEGDNSQSSEDPLLRHDDAQSLSDMERNLALLREQRDLLPADGINGQNQSYMVYSILLFALVGIGLLYWSWRAGWLQVVWQGGMIYLSWRGRRQVVLQPISIMLEKSFIKIGLRPPKAIHLWARRALLPPVSKAYLQINLALERLGATPSPTETPFERAARLGRLVPTLDKPAHRLVREYHIATFSQKPANMVIAWNAATEIRNQTRGDLFRRWFSRK
jgi:transglutaminase-like putative cysteine protease